MILTMPTSSARLLESGLDRNPGVRRPSTGEPPTPPTSNSLKDLRGLSRRASYVRAVRPFAMLPALL